MRGVINASKYVFITFHLNVSAKLYKTLRNIQNFTYDGWQTGSIKVSPSENRGFGILQLIFITSKSHRSHLDHGGCQLSLYPTFCVCVLKKCLWNK